MSLIKRHYETNQELEDHFSFPEGEDEEYFCNVKNGESPAEKRKEN